jgi:hypothetical protein
LSHSVRICESNNAIVLLIAISLGTLLRLNRNIDRGLLATFYWRGRG